MKPVWIVQVRLRNGRWASVGAEDKRTTAEITAKAYYSHGLPPRILRYIPDSGLKPIAKDSFGELFRKDFDGDAPLVYVKVMNSTPESDGSIKPYFLSVNPQHYGGEAGTKPHAAIASTWRTAKDGKELFFKRYEEYRPGIET